MAQAPLRGSELGRELSRRQWVGTKAEGQTEKYEAAGGTEYQCISLCYMGGQRLYCRRHWGVAQ